MENARGVQTITAAFARAKAQNRAALMPYAVLGYPTPEASLAVVEAAVAGGADVVELGVPFSDPLADGPIIQAATQRALEQGTSVPACLEAVRALRSRGLATPFMLMGYYNPILAYGEEAFCQACQAVGADGLIVPDLPPEEGAGLEEACRARGLALVYLLAPTSPPERVQLVAEHSQGFVYLVSVAGITGARDRLPPNLADFVRRVRALTSKPLAVGFGISTPAQAAQVAALADGVIVGSAVVRRAGEPDGPAQVRAFVHSLRHGLGDGG
ncbi:MAG: tryptophan synthase subunit alpha [Thermoflexales bacterium]|nr:tryptophan synthase subunit alpha [Thermoflexales bacterium]